MRRAGKRPALQTKDRKSVVEGKSVDLGGGRIIKKKKKKIEAPRGSGHGTAPGTSACTRASLASPPPRLTPTCTGAQRENIAVLSVVPFFQAEDGIRDYKVTGVQTCALPISAIPFFSSRRRHTRLQGDWSSD